MEVTSRPGRRARPRAVTGVQGRASAPADKYFDTVAAEYRVEVPDAAAARDAAAAALERGRGAGVRGRHAGRRPVLLGAGLGHRPGPAARRRPADARACGCGCCRCTPERRCTCRSSAGDAGDGRGHARRVDHQPHLVGPGRLSLPRSPAAAPGSSGTGPAYAVLRRAGQRPPYHPARRGNRHHDPEAPPTEPFPRGAADATSRARAR